jgi:hypothetical protein
MKMNRKWIFDSNTVWGIYYYNGRFMSVRTTGYHESLDIYAKLKTKFYASEEGFVSYHYVDKFVDGTKPLGGWKLWCSYPYGGVAVLEGDSGVTYLFCHLDPKTFPLIEGIELTRKALTNSKGLRASALFSGRKRVKAGELIGYVGNVGQSSRPHIHLETWKAGNRIDPEKLWPRVDFSARYNYGG